MSAKDRLSLLSIWGNNNLDKKIKGKEGKIYVQKKSLYKKWWVWSVVVLILGIAELKGTSSSDNSTDTEVASEKSAQKSPFSEELIEEDPLKQSDIPEEYKSALSEAESHSKSIHMSKKGVYDLLTSEYGEQFSTEAAQYAIDHVKADWKENALQSAEIYAETMHMSKAGIYDELVSEFGEQFTAGEAQYAIDNVVVDWNLNALKTAKIYREMTDLSPNAIKKQLKSSAGEQFTPQQADYAIENLN